MMNDALIDRLRKETPACRYLIHFNNAGASLMPDCVYDTLVDHLGLERKIGGYEAADSAKQALADFYTQFGRLLNADPQEIAFIENATRAWDMAVCALDWREGDRIITHASEYVSNYLIFLQLAKFKGVEIDIAPSDESGQIDVEALGALVTSKTRMIAITHIPTQGGLINPAAAVGHFAKAHGLIYMLDACQSVGQMHIDVEEIGCDILSGTGRKFLRGPRGTGFLYVSSKIADQLHPPFIDLASANWIDQENYELKQGAIQFENWESFIAGRLGLARAVDYTLEIGLNKIESRVQKLAASLREKLGAIDGVELLDLGRQKSAIVTFRTKQKSAAEITSELREKAINVSVSNAASARLDFGPRNISFALRASVHYFNTQGEIDQFCDLLENEIL